VYIADVTNIGNKLFTGVKSIAGVDVTSDKLVLVSLTPAITPCLGFSSIPCQWQLNYRWYQSHCMAMIFRR
jgi:hypothetical protein